VRIGGKAHRIVHRSHPEKSLGWASIAGTQAGFKEFAQEPLKNRRFVVPAQAGTQFDEAVLDARLRGNDGNSDLP
jgi:hypothetical protein